MKRNTSVKDKINNQDEKFPENEIRSAGMHF